MNRLLALTALFTASVFAADAPPRTEEQILKSVKLPAGYEATVFAMPPHGGYPTAVSASADGVLFVAADENGSLDAKPGRGRVVRMRDTDADGKADEFKVFAEMDSPRGVIWDGPTGAGPGTLYVMYPPKLTAFTDTDGDGKADKQEDIVTGLGFDLKFRGADHTTNGCRLAIDGFIYIAVGDYGFTRAVAKDGTALTMRGGGIVRVRPDGTGFEIVSHGQRNIYDMAVSPTLDLFTRDNTNDGGGWEVRLSFVPPGAHMGYPTLFKNFGDEIVQPLAVLGGGSPCGALWIDEPGLQNGLYTVEWGRNAIMYHPLTADGAGFKQEQVEWLKMTRPTDMDVDAGGALYIASWEGATFNYNGPNAGYVLRVVKKGNTAKATDGSGLPPLSAPVQRLSALFSGSAVERLAAQREILASVTTTEEGAAIGMAIGMALAEGQQPLAGRINSLFLLAQLMRKLHPDKPFNVPPGAIPSAQGLEEFILRAMGDHGAALGAKTNTAPLIAGLSDTNARVRAAAITALRRLGRTDAAPQMLPLVADSDPIVSHLAIRALSELKAASALLAALDSAMVPPAGAGVPPEPSPKAPGGTPTLPGTNAIALGALRALHAIYEPAVVDGLLARLPAARGELRRGILAALCRLDNQDAPYVDPKVWWGTRPDTSGPVYKPERWAESDRIEAALKTALDTAPADEGSWLVQTMYRAKVNFPGLIDLMLAKAGTDTAAKLTAVEGLFASDNALPPEGLAALRSIATDEKLAPDFRAKALRLLTRASEHGAALDAAIAAFAPLAGNAPGHAPLAAAFEDFTRDGKHTRHLGALQKTADGQDAAKRTLAQTILVNLATSALVKGKDHDAAAAAVEKAWAKPGNAANLLGVIARTKAKAYAGKVTAHLKDPDNAVAEAALFAYQSLGLKDTGAPAQPIAAMKYEDVFAAVQKGGDAAQGKDIYLRSGCIACHTIGADEPPKGPVLSAAAKIYDRAALTESILKPGAKLAQGFESAWFKTKKGEQIEGFVTREGGDSLDVRNVAGQTVTLEKADIAERGKREHSMMPDGLMNAFTPAELASLLAYLESLKK